jgi:glycosidase
MAHSLFEQSVVDALAKARADALSGQTKSVTVGTTQVSIPVPFKSPEDWRDHVIYFLMVDRFNCPGDTRNPLPFEEKTDKPLGGTLKGITQKLDYIRDLGATAIWVSPVQKNTKDSIHGYSIQDFLSVDPRFGTDDDLIELIDQAHARGIYVILDIVLNHAGNVFAYDPFGNTAPHREDNEPQYPIYWRKEDGSADPNWHTAPNIGDLDLTADAAVYPDQIRNNEYFRRRGLMGSNEQHGDFVSLKELITEYVERKDSRDYFPVRDLLIKIHQYLIAKYDCDGYRVDTIKHVERDCELVFGNAIREFASTIGKTNFLTFGEAKTDKETTLAAYTGRYAGEAGDLFGLDSTLDFPVMWKMQQVCKGDGAPSELANLYEYRKNLLRGGGNDGKVLVSSHGEAGRFYITKLDNHDEHRRFRYCPKPQDINAPSAYDRQVTMAFGSLSALLGIPCIYYGTEQGLRGACNGDSNGGDWYVREALWGKPGGGFGQNNQFYKEIKKILALRAATPAMRYGRQYFRPLSGNGHDFGMSSYKGGVIAFSRILHDTEIVVLANTSTTAEQHLSVVIDFDLNSNGKQHSLEYSNYGAAAQMPESVHTLPKYSVSISDVNGFATDGPIRCIHAHLKPMELQILR